MKSIISTLVFLLLLASTALAQSARVQVIHNAPDPVVDIYVNGALALNDFEFRSATPFLELPAGLPLTLAVAPGTSASAAEALASFDVIFESGKTYALTASGIVGGMPGFTVIADDAARETAPAGVVALNVTHGAPDAPAVDVAVRTGSTIVSNLAYGAFTPYLEVPAGVYYLDVKPAGSQTILATYKADLSALGGQAIRVLASGFLTGGTPSFTLIAVLADGTVVELPAEAVARVQVIHNSPAPTVDVYANGALLLDNFVFRTATPFVYLPAGVDITLGVAPDTSTSAASALASFTVNLENGRTYVVTASGLVGGTPGFGLIVDDGGRENSAAPGTVDVAVLHGSPGAPAVDVDAVFLADNLIQNLAYGEFTGYLGLPPAVFDLAVRATGDPNVVATYRADLSGLAGGAAYVFASGILGGTPGFGLFAALPDGQVLELPLTPTARVQIVHNSPSPTVDVYAGNTRLLDDFVFRTATPFLNVPADRTFVVGVALANSNSAAEAIATFPVSFEAGETYAVFASGVVGSAERPFTLLVDAEARETGAAGVVQVGVHHGSPTPGPIAVDVDERLAGNLLSNFDYGQFSPYLDLPADLYYLDVRAAGNPAILATFQVDLSALDGQAIRVFASGILGGDPAFGLFAVLSDGTVVELPVAPVARVQVVHNAPSPTVDVYANGDLLLDDFVFRTATPFVYLPAGVQIEIAVAPGNSQSVADAIATFPATFENGRTYAVFANGLVGGTPAFGLSVFDNARERSSDDNQLELAIHHGSPGAPSVDVTPVDGDAPIVTNLAYGAFTDYLGIEPGELLLDLTTNPAPNTLLGTWGGDFSGLEGVAGIVFASGLAGGDPEFDLLLVLPDGSVFGVPSYARVQVIHNAPSPTVDVYYDAINILDDFEFRTATPIGFLPARTPFTLGVAPANSQSAAESIYTLDVPEVETGKAYVITAAGSLDGSPAFGLFINENGRFRGQSAGSADIALFHGAPDAPEVDVKLAGGPVIFDNIAFGEYSDYLSVPAAEYVIQVTPFNDNNTVVATYTADLSSLGGQAATVFASGFLASEPGFEVWVALTDGTTFPLPLFVSTNELDRKIASLQMAPNPAASETYLRLELTETEALRYRVHDAAGRLVLEGDLGTVGAGEVAQRIDLSGLNTGLYRLEIQSDAGVRTTQFVVQR